MERPINTVVIYCMKVISFALQTLKVFISMRESLSRDMKTFAEVSKNIPGTNLWQQHTDLYG